MAKKSLKKRIDSLVDALGGAEKPTVPEIRSELVTIGTFVQELEDGQALAGKEAAITRLEVENENLKVELQSAKEKIKAFAVERKKQEDKKWDLPPIQFEILERLPSQHGGLGLTMHELWREVGGRLDEIEIHVDKLEKAGLIAWHMEADGKKFWRRTMPGNELVVARRLAGETEEKEEKKRCKYQDLPEIQHKALCRIADGQSDGASESVIALGIGATPPAVRWAITCLRKAGLVDTPYEETSFNRRWFLLDGGAEYLAERDLL